MKMLRTFLSIFVLLLAACSPTVSPVQTAPALRIAYTDRPGDYVLILAEALGYFEQRGLDVTPVKYSNISESYPEISTGMIDGINISPIDLLPIIRENDMRIILVTGSSTGADQIVASADVPDVPALAGRRLGVSFGTYGEFLVVQMLASAGLTRADVTLVNISPDNVPYSIPGQIDAGHTWNPHTTAALRLGEHVIFTSHDLTVPLLDVFAMRVETTRTRPEDVENFVAAWLEAAQWWKEHPEEGSSRIATYLGANPDEISLSGIQLFNASDNLAFFTSGTTGGSNIRTIAQRDLDFMIEAGYITIPPDLSVVLEPSFLP